MPPFHIIIGILLCAISCVLSRNSVSFIYHVDHCENDMDISEICQRCDKISISLTSQTVFNMCCYNYADVFFHCRDYVHFGIK